MNLTKHFSLEELTVSQTATRKGIDNSPILEYLDNLKLTAKNMEVVRELMGNQPVHISSGYRNTFVNMLIGGSLTSSHTTGYAIDFLCSGFGTPYEICKLLQESNIKYDQLIHEFGRWVHISFDPKNRQQDLTASRVDGRVVYSKGVNNV